jgi:type III secretion protein R
MTSTIALASGGPGVQGWSSQPVLAFLGIAALSIAPFVLLLLTSFVKISVVLAILKSALGTAQIPPSQIVTGLALILTLCVMAPTGERMFKAAEADLGRGAGAELLSGKSLEALGIAVGKAKEPLREFLLKQTSAKERTLFYQLSLRMRNSGEGASVSEHDFLVVAPAFLASELRRAFEIGFLILIPFLVVDLVVAGLLAALGMNMLSPTSVSLPFKLLLFVLADGWQLLLRGLIASYV